MKRNLLLFVVCIIGLSSCYTFSEASIAISTWNNHSKRELVSQWGAPNQVFPTDEGEILVYYGNAQYYHNAWTGEISGAGTCKIQFFIDKEERIYTHSFENCGYKYIIQREFR